MKKLGGWWIRYLEERLRADGVEFVSRKDGVKALIPPPAAAPKGQKSLWQQVPEEALIAYARVIGGKGWQCLISKGITTIKQFIERANSAGGVLKLLQELGIVSSGVCGPFASLAQQNLDVLARHSSIFDQFSEEDARQAQRALWRVYWRRERAAKKGTEKKRGGVAEHPRAQATAVLDYLADGEEGPGAQRARREAATAVPAVSARTSVPAIVPGSSDLAQGMLALLGEAAARV